MGMHQFIQGLSNLETLRRAPGFFKYQEHSVAAHSFKVAEIAQMLGDVEELAGNKVNWQMLYEKSLNHDYTERFIGDIKTPVKYATPTLRQMLADVEATMTENLRIRLIYCMKVLAKSKKATRSRFFSISIRKV